RARGARHGRGFAVARLGARRARRAADPGGAGGAGRSRLRRPAGAALRLRALPLARRARRLRWTGRRFGVDTASMVMGLTTGLWVSAQVRICDRAFIPATVVRRGDPDAGTGSLNITRSEAGVTVYPQASWMGDGPAWSRGTGPSPVPEADADAYIARQVARDPDVWVLEIEDRKGQYQLDGKVV